MPISLDEATAVQRRHEGRIMAMPGVTGVGVKLRDDHLVLEILVDPEAEMPEELADLDELDSLPVVVDRGRYELQ
jgi:hypothetical protein